MRRSARRPLLTWREPTGIMRRMRRLIASATLSAIATLSACGGSGWTKSPTPSCSGGPCVEYVRTDPAASIVIVTGRGELPSGDGYADCSPVRGVAAVCRQLSDREQVVWRGVGDACYEASGDAMTSVELIDFVSDLDLESAGLRP